jgi:hypothetical protein
MSARTPIAAVAVIAAVLISLGSGAALASPAVTGRATAGGHVARPVAAADPAASGLAWHRLHLVSGWIGYAPQINGAPAYAVRDGVLYLRGALISKRPDPAASTFAVLPAAARPRHYLVISCVNVTSVLTAGALGVTPAGDLQITLPASPATPSLSGISFPLSS